MNINQTRPPWPAPRQRLQTALERIDEILERNRQEYETARINLARRIVFGDAAIDTRAPQYESQSI